MNTLVRETVPDLAHAAAEWITQHFAARSGRLAICLSGGSTPKLLYETLAQSPYRDRMPWDRLHIFWGDERFVPPDDPASNQAMVRHALLDHVPIPPGNIHPILTVGLTPDQAAYIYDATLRTFQPDAKTPLFDLVLLGLGTNGHTASLFPNEPVLQERKMWAAPSTPPGEPTRITLTWPPLESCRNAAFLVTGAAKHEMVTRVQAGDQTVVAARYRPAGTLHWWLDAAAAG